MAVLLDVEVSLLVMIFDLAHLSLAIQNNFIVALKVRNPRGARALTIQCEAFARHYLL